jgi:hypothetical protein
VPISTNECPESKPGRRPPERASSCIAPTVAADRPDDAQIPERRRRTPGLPWCPLPRCRRVFVLRAGDRTARAWPSRCTGGRSATAPGRSEERVSHSEHVNDLG